jgi:hypothetical protein
MNEQKEFYESVTKSIDKETAIKMYRSNWWEGMEPKKIATIGLITRELCLPFDVLHKAVEESLGRPVWTHEFALDFKGIYLELIGEKDAPSMEEIINLIPEEKRIVIRS